MKIHLLIATLSLAAASPALALTSATFNLEGHDCSHINQACYDSLPSFFDLDDNGLTARFSGKTFQSPFSSSSIDWSGYTNGGVLDGATVIDSRIGRYAGGAGVANSIGDDHTVDSVVRDDFIEVSFFEASQPKAVQIQSIEFGFFKAGSNHFRLMWDSNGTGVIDDGDRITKEYDIESRWWKDNYGIFHIGGALETSVFAVGAFNLGSNSHYDDEWKLREVTVHYTPHPIPLPASALMLLAAVGGVGVMKMRRKA